MARLQSFLVTFNRSCWLPRTFCTIAPKSILAGVSHSYSIPPRAPNHRTFAVMAAKTLNPKKIQADPKRIIIACDGTWDDDNYGMEKTGILPWTKETPKPPSNVTRICRSILPFDGDMPQIVYYQAGIGSEHTLKDKLWGGLTGFGISEHVREAYAFICHNYVENDEIIILGFSRGAFTARTISSMVSDLGLLSMRGMSYFFPIFKDWENQIVPGYVSPFEEPWPAGTFPDLMQKPNIKDVAYADWLEEVKSYLSLFCGCTDIA